LKAAGGRLSARVFWIDGRWRLPDGNPEEVAAIVAALGSLSEEEESSSSLKRSRWRLAGLLGHDVDPSIELEGSLWAYSRWKG
jgi:hypothetical protein